MSKQKVHWECTSCGHVQAKWAGSCGVCEEWNTFVEQISMAVNKKHIEAKSSVSSKPIRLTDINIVEFAREKTHFGEFDRLLGGGLVGGSLLLVGGDPGVGKSTLMLQIACSLAKTGKKVLYICGEESVEQTSLRARRLGGFHEQVFLLNETEFHSVKVQIDQLKPDILIVDSVQILYKSDIPSAPGSVVQVREIATEFMHIAKGYGITTFLIGHVTKSGDIAGPRVLEHLVDVVLDFEGDKQHGFRLLRSIKNRFGPTDDLALFYMKERGLEEVTNPSVAFLEERKVEIAGSVVVPTIEGIRAMLIEIQALVTPSAFSTPSRRSAGLDQNRLALLLAVLEKRVGYQLHHYDVFVSVAGGMRIKEPAIDLAILLSIASSFSNSVLDAHTIALGEVGLGGEIRSVTRIEARIKEAINMGFKRCVLPKRNYAAISKKFSGKMNLIGIDIVDQAMDILLN